MLNQARLRALKVREDHIRNVLDEARRRLGEVTRNQQQYSHILQQLIIQGLYQVIFQVTFTCFFIIIFYISLHSIPVVVCHSFWSLQ